MSLTTGAVQDVPPATGDDDAILKKLTATGRQGTKGRLVMNDFTFSVALYESAEKTGPDATEIVDAKDSAAWFIWYGSQSPIVADHCTQGFDVIKSCEPGDICYIVQGDSFERFQCVEVDPDGVNAGHDLFLSSGYNILRDNDPGYLYMYTCNKQGDSYHVTVVTWIPIESEAEE